jgi:hypothetical protein
LGDDALRLRGHAWSSLGRTAGPFAQALDVARLGEVERRKDGQPDHRGKARVGPDLLNDLWQASEL